MRSHSSLHKLMAPTAALAVVASVLGIAGAPATAEGPCGTTILSGDTTRIGNQVFLDADGNGTFDPTADTGLPGVNLAMWLDADGDGAFEPGGDDGEAVCTTATDAAGQYWFTEVASGTYFVAVTGGVPSGHVSSVGTNADPTVDNNDNGAPAAGQLSVAGPLVVDANDSQPTDEAAPGAAAGADEAVANAINGQVADANSNLTIDFGFAPSDEDGTSGTPICGSIGNRVFFDENGNGYDDNDPGIDGVTVQLFAADTDGNPTGPVISSTVTTGGGYYQFTCVDPGTYVVVIPSSNFDLDGPLSGRESTTDNAGAADGDLVDDGVNPANAGDPVVSQPVDVVIGGAPADEADKPAVDGLDFDAPADDSSDTTVDFGFVPEVSPPTPPPASIGDKVWMDTNGDGMQDDGEPGVADVMVNLLDADGQFLDSTKTDADGMYLFDELAPGTYTVCFDVTSLPEGKIVTIQDAGDNANDANDSDAGPAGCTPAVTLEPGDAVTDIDLGIVDEAPTPVETASIGDKVWIDANNNGVQDEGEEPVPGVTVNLVHEDGTIVDTTVTDANGMYGFVGLEPGEYQICFNMQTLPDGMIETAANQGDADDLDSDAGPDGCTPQTTLDPGENDPTFDLGIRQAASDVGVIKTGRVDGNNQVWTITITNQGPDRNPGPITLTDTLPAGLDLALGTGGGFDCNAAGQTITCVRNAELAVGESAVVTVTTTTNDNAGCSVTNTASVSSAASDTVVANNSSTSTITVPCANPGTLTRTPTPARNLPVTGSSTGPLLAGALLLAATGWKLLVHVRRERPVSIEDILG